ncbi:MAG: SDR family NAD(P)-dependent oxidoreductase, partial [Candidatus Omnitrophica bacterium]|nr:SDR family NAD(P)-dependent oxidoreductase [Candidatus Omnitrophota bacterium]
MRLKDKVALVTGGARGIGQAIAMTFAREGADIAVADVNLEIAQKTCSDIENLGRKAFAVDMDVTNYEKVEEGINKILDKLGKVDILVNNAGITKDNILLRMSQADWDAV